MGLSRRGLKRAPHAAEGEKEANKGEATLAPDAEGEGSEGDKAEKGCVPTPRAPGREHPAPQQRGELHPMQVRAHFRQRRAADDKGIALLVVLAVVAILAVVIFDFSFSVRVDMHIAANFRDRLIALEAAKGGVYHGIYLLRQDDPGQDNLQEDWAQLTGIVLDKTDPDQIAAETALAEEDIALLKHEDYLARQEKGTVPTATIFICDEERKINVNMLAGGTNPAVYRQWVQTLIENMRLSDVTPYELVDNIADWVDTDEDGQAEYTYYESLPVPYSCRNGPMESVYELKLVKGITDLLFFGTKPYPMQLSGMEEESWEEREQLGYKLPETAPWEKEMDPNAVYGLVNFLTVHSTGRINFSTAPREVLLAVFENDEFVADAILEARQENPTQVRELQLLIQQASPDLYNILLRSGLTTTQSTYFRIESTGKFHRSAVKVTAIISRTNAREVAINYWRVEDVPPETATDDLALANVM